MMTPQEMIRETLNELTANCNYIGVLPQAATQAWADEIVKRLNASKLLKDGVLNNDDLQQPFGGEIWKQPDFPCFSVYIVTGVPSDRDDGVKHSHLALSTDPREIGNTLCDRNTKGHMTFTGEELAKHLHDLKYECQGQLYHILLDEQYPGFIEELKSDEKRKHEWTGQ